MSEVLLREKVDSHLTWLVERTAALDQFHAGSARLVLNDFCDWFVRDEVGSHLFEAVRTRAPITAKDWHEQANREAKLPPLPEDPLAAMGFRFNVLWLVRREKVDLKYFVTNHFPGTYLNECLMHWKRLIVHPFAADCRTVAKLGRARLREADEWVDVPAFLHDILEGPFQERAFGPRAWTDADDEAEEAAEAPAPPEAPPPRPVADAPQGLTAALEALHQQIARSDGGDDALLDVEALRLEATRPTPRPDRVRTRLRRLAERPELNAACAALEQAWAQRS